MKKVDSRYVLIVGILLVAIFIFAQPKLSAQLFTFKRQALWSEFQQNVKSSKAIDGPTFWKFREFYYPGYFTFEVLSFDTARINPALEKLSIEFLPKSNPYVFLMYSSDKFNSLEALVDTKDLPRTLKDGYTSKGEILVNDSSNSMYVSGKKARIIFMKPALEMVKANGYYDYRDPDDRRIIQGKYWVSISEVELD